MEAGADGSQLALRVSSDLGRTWSASKPVLGTPEAISADGENRPKLAFGPKGDIYISYTSPLAKPYTGNIRFVRSLDGGRTFSAPVTVHADRQEIGHRFDALVVDRAGRIFIAWIDRRDAAAALYYAVSDDRGASFRGDYRFAEHSCECCHIALALNAYGMPVAFWRQIYGENVRDHAMATLSGTGRASTPVRTTFDNQVVESCPHQGPAVQFGPDGTRHQAWFSLADGGRLLYAAKRPHGALTAPVRLGAGAAAYPDIAVHGDTVVVAWEQFDGTDMVAFARISTDGGHTWRERELLRHAGATDHPRLAVTPSGIVLVWRTREAGILVATIQA
jgi:hypothetical protein